MVIAGSLESVRISFQRFSANSLPEFRVDHGKRSIPSVIFPSGSGVTSSAGRSASSA